MITKNTVFVLGAGSSYPYGYPVGSELVRHIIDDGNLPSKICRTPMDEVFKINVQKFKKQLENANPTSIDTFLSTRDDLVNIGRLVIVAKILEYEHKAETPTCQIDHRQDWHKHLFHLMHENTDNFETFLSNKVTFITFNYDRSFDSAFIRFASSMYKGITTELVVSALEAFPIFHMHGNAIPYYENMLAYGEILAPDMLKHAANNINIIHDNIDKDDKWSRVHKSIADAEMVVFLGFGFHKTNVERLAIWDHLPPKMKIGYTRMGMSDAQVRRLIDPMLERYLGTDKSGKHIHASDESEGCAEWFKNHEDILI